jgi:NTP pyrophosphatase (non-canonical NTP hydrolase)
MKEYTPKEMEAIVRSHNEKVGFWEYPIETQVSKLVEEAQEVGEIVLEAHFLGQTPERSIKIKEELGDVLALVIDLSLKSGTNLEEIFEAVMYKNMIRYNGAIREMLEAEGFTGLEAYKEAKRRRG